MMGGYPSFLPLLWWFLITTFLSPFGLWKLIELFSYFIDIQITFGG